MGVDLGIGLKSILTLAIGVFVVLLLAVIALSALGEEGNRPGYCQHEETVSAPAGESRLVVADKNQPTKAEDQNKDALEEGERVTLRQVCEENPAPSGPGFLSILVATMAFSVAVMGALLAHWTAVEERPTKRARLQAVFPDPVVPVVRIINIGGSVGRLLGLGSAPGPIWYVGDGWSRLRPYSRFVPVSDGEPVEFPLGALPSDELGLFSILIRFEDVYGEIWEVWRTFRMDASRKLAPVEDGERKARRK